MATGLLILCTGKHTKQIPQIQDAPKVYTGTIALGASTPSYDLETEVDATFPTEHITPEPIEQVPPREITIYSLELTLSGEKELSFRVHCSKGTYIRSLAHDIGKALGSGAHLTSLRRIQIGEHSVAHAYTPEDFVQQFINHTPHETKTIH